MPSLIRNRNWCFTSFFLDLNIDKAKIKYIIYGREICPDTGRLHLQGYIELNNTVTLTAVKKVLGHDSVHLEPRRGTQIEAIEYCKKEDKCPFEYGTPGRQGYRTDLKEILDDCKDIKELKKEYPQVFCQYRQGVIELMNDKIEDSIAVWRKVEVIVFYGASRTGKTWRATHDYPNAYQLDGSKDRPWWNGYNGQETVIIDEFRGKIDFGLFLKILEGYKMQGEIKGGFVWLQYLRVVITTNVMPECWYPLESDIEPLLNRISSRVEFKNKVKL